MLKIKREHVHVITDSVTLKAITFLFVGDAKLVWMLPLHPLRLLVHGGFFASNHACIETSLIQSKKGAIL